MPNFFPYSLYVHIRQLTWPEEPEEKTIKLEPREEEEEATATTVEVKKNIKHIIKYICL